MTHDPTDASVETEEWNDETAAAYFAKWGKDPTNRMTVEAADLAPDDVVTAAQRRGPRRFGRTEDRHGWHAQSGGEVHGAGVVGEHQVAGGEFVAQFLDAGFTSPISRLDGGNGIGQFGSQGGLVG